MELSTITMPEQVFSSKHPLTDDLLILGGIDLIKTSNDKTQVLTKFLKEDIAVEDPYYPGRTYKWKR